MKANQKNYNFFPSEKNLSDHCFLWKTYSVRKKNWDSEKILQFFQLKNYIKYPGDTGKPTKLQYPCLREKHICSFPIIIAGSHYLLLNPENKTYGLLLFGSSMYRIPTLRGIKITDKYLQKVFRCYEAMWEIRKLGSHPCLTCSAWHHRGPPKSAHTSVMLSERENWVNHGSDPTWQAILCSYCWWHQTDCSLL